MSEPETCDARMNPVAGGGFLYCNALKGHEGLHSHTFPGVFVGNAGLNLFSRVPSGRMVDYLHCESPIATDIMQVLECANGLRPLEHLDPVIWYDTNANLSQMVDGK